MNEPLVLIEKSASSAPAMVVLRLVNRGSGVLLLAGPRLGKPRMDGDYFSFDSAHVRYLGIQRKRGPYSISEVIALDAGAELEFLVNLDDYYDFGGTTAVSLRYEATHPLDGVDQAMRRIASNTIVID